MRPKKSSYSGCALADRDLILAKIATIDRCIRRVLDVHSRGRTTLQPIDAEDIVLINLQRSVQAAMDLATHLVTSEGYGLPDSAGASFALLGTNGVIPTPLAGQLQRMVGFRNIAVHEYQALDPDIIEAIVTKHLDDLLTFSAIVMERFVS